MSAAELSTLVASNLPVKVLIINNHCLGMVRQWQELFYDHVYSHSLLPQPDFEALARAHGCWATTVNRRDELENALREAALHPARRSSTCACRSKRRSTRWCRLARRRATCAASTRWTAL